MDANKNNYDSLLAGAFGPTLVLDLRTDRVLSANSSAQTLFKNPELVGSRMSDHVLGELSQFIVFVEEVLHRNEAWTRRITLKTTQSDELSCEITGRCLPESDGEAVLFNIIDLGTMQLHEQQAESEELFRGGVFEWTRAQSFFSELERQNQLILNAAGEGIYGVNADGKTTFVNRAAQEMLGWTTEDLLGRDIHSMIHHHHLNGEAYPSHQCPIYKSFRHDEVNRIEDEVFWRKDGKPIRVEYVSTPIHEGQILVGAVVIFRDITERWESQRKLNEAMAEVAALRDRLMQENAYLQEAINIERAHHDIIGHSAATRQLITQIELVSNTNANVLITGESGSGKSLLASAIHNDSSRSRRVLIHFKGGAVTGDMIESELFGHVRGAFSGAVRDKPGKLELAHGGTLFIDEITDIPFELQGRLLETLQQRSVTRMGDVRSRAIDLRVIASTSRDLQLEVQAGRMRADLMLFLNIFPIHCTPLRDRPEDIPPLVAHLLQMACKRLGRKVPIVTAGSMQKLQAYDWPGNVRELANVIERGAIVSTSGKLMVDIENRRAPENRKPSELLSEADIEQIRMDNTLACLREANGRVSGKDGAAALLGIRPTTLYSRLQKLGISSQEAKKGAG